VDEVNGTGERASEALSLLGAAEPRQDGAPPLDNDAQPLDDDEIEIIGDLGNEFDDPEGWMALTPSRSMACSPFFCKTAFADSGVVEPGAT